MRVALIAVLFIGLIGIIDAAKCKNKRSDKYCEKKKDKCSKKKYQKRCAATCKACPVDGGFTKWSDYSECSKDCQGGTQSKTRTCTNPKPANGGKDCKGDKIKTRPCNQDKPCPVDGGFTKWSAFSDCSKDCQGGTKTRTRTCTNPKPAHGGKNCVGISEETLKCNEDKPCPVDGGFSKWSEWDKCSKDCQGGGWQMRHRKCDNPKPAHGGKYCEDIPYDERRCNEDIPCPVDGGFTKWSDFSECSKDCNGGTKTRTRTCTSPKPAHGGKNCVGISEETLKCNQAPCKVDGGYSNWSEWSKCSKACRGGGWQLRYRTCDNPKPAHGGKTCHETPHDERRCNEDVPCPEECHEVAEKIGTIGKGFVEEHKYLYEKYGCAGIEDAYKRCSSTYPQNFIDYMVPKQGYDCGIIGVIYSYFNFNRADANCFNTFIELHKKGINLSNENCDSIKHLVGCDAAKDTLKSLGVSTSGIECKALKEMAANNGSCPTDRYLTPGDHMCGKLCCTIWSEVTSYPGGNCRCIYAGGWYF